MTLNEKQVLETIQQRTEQEGEDFFGAEQLLWEADHSFETKFLRYTTALSNLLEEVRKHFPDAGYYTASGGFNLMLTQPHSPECKPQAKGVARSAIRLEVGDGDF